MNAKLVSIVVPIYNSEKYLSKCIDSIINQSYKHLEIILIDDGSTDGSSNICDKYLKQDDRIIVKHVQNGGVSRARNIGISISSSEYICFIDSDDYIPENYVERLYEAIENNKADLTICGIKNVGFYHSCQLLEDRLFSFDDNDFWKELNEKFLLYGPVNKMYRRKCIIDNNIQFDESISYGEDLIFNFDYLKYISSIYCVSNTHYYYYHDNVLSLSKKYRKNRFENELLIHNAMKQLMIDKSLYTKDMEQYLYNRILYTINHCIFDIFNNEEMKVCKEKFKYILHHEETKKTIKIVGNSENKNPVVFFVRYKMVLPLLVYLNIRKKLKRM